MYKNIIDKLEEARYSFDNNVHTFSFNNSTKIVWADNSVSLAVDSSSSDLFDIYGNKIDILNLQNITLDKTPIYIISNISTNCVSQDTNSDEKIGLVDLSNLLSKYNTNCEVSDEDYGVCGGQDSNNDGKISLVDLSNLLSKYNKSCN